MMSSLSLRSITSSSIAAVVLAFIFALGGVQAHAGYLVACSLEKEVMKNSMEAAEELDVLCSYFVQDTRIDSAQLDVATPIAASDQSEVVPLSALVGQAIRVPITQTVTVAAPDEELEKDEDANITGAVTPPQPGSIIASTQNELRYYIFDNPPLP